MAIEDGRIYIEEKVSNMSLVEKARMQAMPVQRRQIPPGIERNEPCPCGSSRKFKKCCLIEEYPERS